MLSCAWEYIKRCAYTSYTRSNRKNNIKVIYITYIVHVSPAPPPSLTLGACIVIFANVDLNCKANITMLVKCQGVCSLHAQQESDAISHVRVGRDFTSMYVGGGRWASSLCVQSCWYNILCPGPRPPLHHILWQATKKKRWCSQRVGVDMAILRCTELVLWATQITSVERARQFTLIRLDRSRQMRVLCSTVRKRLVTIASLQCNHVTVCIPKSHIICTGAMSLTGHGGS